MAVAVLSACGDDDDGPCDPLAQSGCDDGLTCELVNDGTTGCFAPVVLRGEVFALADGSAVAGARVVALDGNGAPVSSVSESGDDGGYELRVSAQRTPEGAPLAGAVTLRADAAGHVTFPAGIRQALPIELGTAVDVDGRLVVESELTAIGLLDGAGGARLSGRIARAPVGRGALVVAEDGSGRGFTAIADASGEFVIFDLPDGDYEVTAYAEGAAWERETVSLADDAEVDLALADGLGTVEGTVQIVNAPGGAATSVLLVVESTFDEGLARGASPPGLRVPDGGLAPDVSGVYRFTDVPPGRYVVLAGFENDGLVRDPDLSIGGTSPLHIEVSAGGTTTVEGFKVTEALAIVGPGADGPERVSGTPTFRWVDDSSEDAYEVVCFDALGRVVWQTTIEGVSGDDPELAYAGPALDAGGTYQFRVTSVKDGTPISRSEDLRGVFVMP